MTKDEYIKQRDIVQRMYDMYNKSIKDELLATAKYARDNVMKQYTTEEIKQLSWCEISDLLAEAYGTGYQDCLDRNIHHDSELDDDRHHAFMNSKFYELCKKLEKL